jgi:hypothetical protein
MRYAIYLGIRLVALFEYEDDRDACLLTLISRQPEFDWSGGTREEVSA